MSHSVKFNQRTKPVEVFLFQKGKEIEPRQRTASPRPSPIQPRTRTVSYSLVRDARPCHANAIPAGRRITTYTHLKNAVPINSLGLDTFPISHPIQPSSAFPSPRRPHPPDRQIRPHLPRARRASRMAIVSSARLVVP
jgi:hypothetical protein